MYISKCGVIYLVIYRPQYNFPAGLLPLVYDRRKIYTTRRPVRWEHI